MKLWAAEFPSLQRRGHPPHVHNGLIDLRRVPPELADHPLAGIAAEPFRELGLPIPVAYELPDLLSGVGIVSLEAAELIQQLAPLWRIDRTIDFEEPDGTLRTFVSQRPDCEHPLFMSEVIVEGCDPPLPAQQGGESNGEYRIRLGSFGVSLISRRYAFSEAAVEQLGFWKPPYKTGVYVATEQFRDAWMSSELSQRIAAAGQANATFEPLEDRMNWSYGSLAPRPTDLLRRPGEPRLWVLRHADWDRWRSGEDPVADVYCLDVSRIAPELIDRLQAGASYEEVFGGQPVPVRELRNSIDVFVTVPVFDAMVSINPEAFSEYRRYDFVDPSGSSEEYVAMRIAITEKIPFDPDKLSPAITETEMEESFSTSRSFMAQKVVDSRGGRGVKTSHAMPSRLAHSYDVLKVPIRQQWVHEVVTDAFVEAWNRVAPEPRFGPDDTAFRFELLDDALQNGGGTWHWDEPTAS